MSLEHFSVGGTLIDRLSVARELQAEGCGARSLGAEVRFTRDVDVVVLVADDAKMAALAYGLLVLRDVGQ